MRGEDLLVISLVTHQCHYYYKFLLQQVVMTMNRYRACETSLLLAVICPAAPDRERGKKKVVVLVSSRFCSPGVLHPSNISKQENILVFLCTCILRGEGRHSHSICMHSGQTRLGILKECLDFSWAFVTCFMLPDYSL